MILIILEPVCFASNNEIINSQAQSTGVSTFLEESKKYVSNTFPDLDINEVFNSSISGELKIDGLFGWIVNLLGDELKQGIVAVVSILIIVVIHSILKSIIENLGNDRSIKNCISYTIFNYSRFNSKYFYRYVGNCKRSYYKYC